MANGSGVIAKPHMRMIWQSLQFHHLGLAFFLACVMLTFRSSVLLCSCLDTKIHTEFSSYVGLSTQAIVLSVLALLIYFRPELAKRLPGKAFIICLVLGLLLLSIGGHGIPELAMFTSLFGIFFCGVGYGYLCGMWANTYGCLHPGRTSFYVPASFVLSLLLYFAVVGISELTGIQATFLVIPLPIISLVSLRKCQKECDAPLPSTTSPSDYLQAFKSLWQLLLGAALFAFILGVSWQLSSASSETVNENHFMPLLISLGISIVYAALVVFLRKRFDMSAVYKIAMPVFMAVFALMPFLYETYPEVLFSATNAAYYLFDIVIWTIATERAYDYRVAGFVLGGAIRSLAIFFRLAGIFTGGLLVSLPQTSGTFITILALAALYFSVIWIIGLIIHRKTKNSSLLSEQSATELSEVPLREELEATEKESDDAHRKNGNSPEVEDELSRRCRHIVEAYRLTRREGEVLPYLAQGRSAKYIAQALFVSENTVRSHISNIMTKLDIRSKEKIIDIVNTVLLT